MQRTSQGLKSRKRAEEISWSCRQQESSRGDALLENQLFKRPTLKTDPVGRRWPHRCRKPQKLRKLGNLKFCKSCRKRCWEKSEEAWRHQQAEKKSLCTARSPPQLWDRRFFSRFTNLRSSRESWRSTLKTNSNRWKFLKDFSLPERISLKIRSKNPQSLSSTSKSSRCLFLPTLYVSLKQRSSLSPRCLPILTTFEPEVGPNWLRKYWACRKTASEAADSGTAGVFRKGDLCHREKKAADGLTRMDTGVKAKF